MFNGRRVQPTVVEGRVDTNTFPDLLIKRVDVVTGGASAAYGSDAVAGCEALLRWRHPAMERPFVSPFGPWGAYATIAISAPDKTPLMRMSTRIIVSSVSMLRSPPADVHRAGSRDQVALRGATAAERVYPHPLSRFD